MKLSIEYLAGFFDGEGCINIYARNNGRQFRIRLMLANTHVGVLREIQAHFGGSIMSPQMPKSEKHKPRYQLVWRGNNAVELLREMEPFSIVKIDEIRLILCEFVPQMGTRTRSGKGGGHFYPESVIDIRRDIKVRLSALKRRIV